MHSKNSVNRGQSNIRSGIRGLFAVVLLVMLSSCATILPGLDRLLFSNSSAKVGPLVGVEEEYPAAEQDENIASDISAEDQSDKTSQTGQENSVSMAKSGQVAGANKTTQTAVRDSQTSTQVITEVITEARESEITSEPESPSNDSTQVAAATKIEVAPEYGSVSGKVVLVGEGDKPLAASGTLITLTPANMKNETQNRPSEVHIVDMEDKTYQPRYSTIQAGDQVVFVNKDDIQHNVFSSSGGNAFDLGTYGAGLKRAVTLKEPGIVKIYCNIHAEMATFVAVGNQGLSVEADAQGRYQINQVLPGRYEATIWNIRGETKRMIEVNANETARLVDRIDTNAFQVERHKNKFGGKYSTNSTLFEDEFY